VGGAWLLEIGLRVMGAALGGVEVRDDDAWGTAIVGPEKGSSD